MVITTPQKHSRIDLALKLKKNRILKWLLNLEQSDIEITEEELQKRLNEITYKNFARLIMINHYFKQIPNSMKSCIDNVIAVKDDTAEFNKRFNDFKNLFETNVEFQELNQYILVNIVQDTLR